jgi:hypothetical protein
MGCALSHAPLCVRKRCAWGRAHGVRPSARMRSARLARGKRGGRKPGSMRPSRGSSRGASRARVRRTARLRQGPRPTSPPINRMVGISPMACCNTARHLCECRRKSIRGRSASSPSRASRKPARRSARNTATSPPRPRPRPRRHAHAHAHAATPMWALEYLEYPLRAHLGISAVSIGRCRRWVHFRVPAGGGPCCVVCSIVLHTACYTAASRHHKQTNKQTNKRLLLGDKQTKASKQTIVRSRSSAWCAIGRRASRGSCAQTTSRQLRQLPFPLRPSPTRPGFPLRPCSHLGRFALRQAGGWLGVRAHETSSLRSDTAENISL